MRKAFIILSVSLVAFASCKKNTQDIQSPKPGAVQTPVTAPVVVSLTAKFTFTVQDPTNIFENQSIKFNNLSTGAASCVWEFGNATKSHDMEPTMSYPMHGWYTVKLTVYDGKGNQQITTQDISILCLFANAVHPPQSAGG
ncbi:MAG: PKD domain-containing protein [Ferruginibacter sp.]